MKFYNNTISISNSETEYLIVDNTDTTKSCVIITLQVINPNDNVVQLIFSRGDSSNSPNSSTTENPYKSSINFKSGTTILDHIMVVPALGSYTVSCPVKYTDNIVISCSYGM